MTFCLFPFLPVLLPCACRLQALFLFPFLPVLLPCACKLQALLLFPFLPGPPANKLFPRVLLPTNWIPLAWWRYAHKCRQNAPGDWSPFFSKVKDTSVGLGKDVVKKCSNCSFFSYILWPFSWVLRKPKLLIDMRLVWRLLKRLSTSKMILLHGANLDFLSEREKSFKIVMTWVGIEDLGFSPYCLNTVGFEMLKFYMSYYEWLLYIM